MPQRSPERAEKSAAEYGREAVSHWSEAARFAARALAERKREKNTTGSLTEELTPGEKVTSEAGELADAVLAKFGKTGKLAAKAGVGRRAVKHLLPEGMESGGGGNEEEDEGGSEGEEGGTRAEAEDDHLFDQTAPMPIQESIDVAVPVAAVFDLCTRFEELPRFCERIDAVEVEDDTHLAVDAKIGTRQRELAIEIVGEEPEERLDWDCADGFEHTGVLSFHPLAPRLTRLELTIEPASEGTIERALRMLGLPERAIRQELRRFKAYAELWDEANEYRSADFKDPASEEAEEEEEPTDEEDSEEEEEPAEEEEGDEGEDEEAVEDEEDLEDEELEPAGKG